jgi:tetratricopeptide (TPR) repeat protein
MKQQPAPPSPQPVTDRRLAALAIVGIMLAALAAYANSFSGVLVYDDEPAILLNPTIRSLGAFWQTLCPPADTTVSGRPVANLSFALNHAFGGTQVWGYHALNLLIHTLAGLTLFGVVRRTLAKTWLPQPASAQASDTTAPFPALRSADATLIAFGAALLWTLHPVQTEAVTYIVQRVESLMGLFFLATFYCFVRSLGSPHASRWRVLAVVACLLGMGTKEVTATAPLLLFLFDRTFVAGSFRRAWAERRGFHLALAATWIPLALLVATTGWNRGGTVGFTVGVSPWTYWLSQFEAVAHYLRLSLWPHPLVFDYATTWTPDLPTIAPYALVVLAFVAATLWALRRHPVAGFLGAWFLVILAPTSIVPSSVQMIVEHRLYLPLAAAMVALAWLVRRWLGRWSLVAFLTLAVASGWATAQRNTVYRSERSVWSDTVAKCPDSERAQNNLGNVLLKAGEAAAAIEHYRTALRLQPDAADTHHNLANALRRSGHPQEAIEHYEQALRLNPCMPDSHTALGIALEEAGRAAEAPAHYEQALRLDPAYADAHNRLGIVLARSGKPVEAIARFESALRSDPSRTDVRNNLGNALREAGRIQEAIAEYEQALRLDPGDAEAHRNLGRTYAMLNRLPDAAAQFEQALRVSPASADTHCELGMILCMAGRIPEGLRHFEQALQLDPDNAQAHLYLAMALEQTGRTAEAAAHFDQARRLGAALPASGN